MPESKTARASAVKVAKEAKVETTEEAIRAIRLNLAGGLFIGDMSRVAKLLAAYDAIKAAHDSVFNELELIKTGIPVEVTA